MEYRFAECISDIAYIRDQTSRNYVYRSLAMFIIQRITLRPVLLLITSYRQLATE